MSILEKIEGKSWYVQKQYLLCEVRDVLDIVNGNICQFSE